MADAEVVANSSDKIQPKVGNIDSHVESVLVRLIDEPLKDVMEDVLVLCSTDELRTAREKLFVIAKQKVCDDLDRGPVPDGKKTKKSNALSTKICDPWGMIARRSKKRLDEDVCRLYLFINGSEYKFPCSMLKRGTFKGMTTQEDIRLALRLKPIDSSNEQGGTSDDVSEDDDADDEDDNISCDDNVGVMMTGSDDREQGGRSEDDQENGDSDDEDDGRTPDEHDVTKGEGGNPGSKGTIPETNSNSETSTLGNEAEKGDNPLGIEADGRQRDTGGSDRANEELFEDAVDMQSSEESSDEQSEGVCDGDERTTPLHTAPDIANENQEGERESTDAHATTRGEREIRTANLERAQDSLASTRDCATQCSLIPATTLILFPPRTIRVLIVRDPEVEMADQRNTSWDELIEPEQHAARDARGGNESDDDSTGNERDDIEHILVEYREFGAHVEFTERTLEEHSSKISALESCSDQAGHRVDVVDAVLHEKMRLMKVRQEETECELQRVRRQLDDFIKRYGDKTSVKPTGQGAGYGGNGPDKQALPTQSSAGAPTQPMPQRRSRAGRRRGGQGNQGNGTQADGKKDGQPQPRPILKPGVIHSTPRPDGTSNHNVTWGEPQ